MGHKIQILKERLNKYFLLLLATTILLGVIGWVLPVGKAKSNYTLDAVLTLGNYDYPELNDPKRVINMLTNPNTLIYQEHLKDLWEERFEEIYTNLHVTAGPDNLITLSYSDHSEESTAKVLNEITTAFLDIDKKKFQEKQKFIQKSIEATKGEKVASEAKVEQLRFLFELNTALNDIKPATLLKPADINTFDTENRAFNSKERAVLGILLGVTLSFLWIVFPVIIRE
ncbi:hypothetical protein KW850_14955 [Bacillus sp. sid0103]|uniref:hypothetical protein n=1 Tax=Bacillus sp. sid0103 TaxID=2856337 RepID=UPI001C4737BF|nr:hypothetical protein [Bacillus sp. sid0103]MBV7506562.1 hypothetical protein [Bacillus sp. sid0103]